MNLRRQPYSTIEYHNATVQADTTMFYDANGNLHCYGIAKESSRVSMTGMMRTVSEW